MDLIKILNESKKIYNVQIDPKLVQGFYLGISTNDALIGKLIKAYSYKWEKIQKEFLASHSFAVFDGTVYESNAAGNQERHITKYIKNGHEFWLFQYRPVLKSNYDIALSYAKGALGRMYDYPGLLRFLFKFIPQLKYGDFCSEYVAAIVQNYLKLPFIELKPEDISPSTILRYCSLENRGWRLAAHYKDGKPIK